MFIINLYVHGILQLVLNSFNLSKYDDAIECVCAYAYESVLNLIIINDDYINNNYWSVCKRAYEYTI